MGRWEWDSGNGDRIHNCRFTTGRPMSCTCLECLPALSKARCIQYLGRVPSVPTSWCSNLYHQAIKSVALSRPLSPPPLTALVPNHPPVSPSVLICESDGRSRLSALWFATNSSLVTNLNLNAVYNAHFIPFSALVTPAVSPSFPPRDSASPNSHPVEQPSSLAAYPRCYPDRILRHFDIAIASADCGRRRYMYESAVWPSGLFRTQADRGVGAGGAGLDSCNGFRKHLWAV